MNSDVDTSGESQLGAYNVPVIFYADDDPDDQDLFNEIVSELKAGYTVHICNNGAVLLEALETAKRLPAMIFLDLNMPVKNGFETLKDLKEDHRWSSIPVIIFSTSNNAQAIKRTKELGADLYISKPDSYKGLKTTIEKVLNRGLQSSFQDTAAHGRKLNG